jgi:hypothetical protein
LLRIDAKRVRDQPAEVFGCQCAQIDVLHPSGGPNRLQLAHERMRWRNFVSPVGTDQQHVPHVRMDQQFFKQIERGDIEPLQIVEEERQWMLRRGEHGQKTTENELEAPLRVLRRQLGD